MGSFMVYLTLIQLPTDWKRVTFLLRLFNAETRSSFTGIATYTKTSNSGGWSDGTLMLNDLKSAISSKKKISLGCKINILQLVGTDDHETILYQYPLKTEYINIMKSKSPIFNIKWVIDDKLLEKFKTANIGKKFESDIFYESWSLRCAPNGKRQNDKNNIKLYLLLCALPPNVVHCKVKYTLSCDEANVQWLNTRDFSYIYPNVGWPNGTMETHDLKAPDGKFKDLKQLTFRAKIEILKLYDADSMSSDDDDSDEDDDDDDSSSYDSSENDPDAKNENDGLGDINRDIMHMDKSRKSSTSHTPTRRRRKSAAKSEIQRRQSQEIQRTQSQEIRTPPTIPESGPLINSSRSSHVRRETDMNTIHAFMSSKMNGGIVSSNYATKADSPYPGSTNGVSRSPQNGPITGFQMRSRNITDLGLLQQFLAQQQPQMITLNDINNSQNAARAPFLRGYQERARTATVIDRATNDDEKKQERNDEMLLEYNERLNMLENNYKTMSSQLKDIAQTLKNLNVNKLDDESKIMN